MMSQPLQASWRSGGARPSLASLQLCAAAEFQKCIRPRWLMNVMHAVLPLLTQIKTASALLYIGHACIHPFADGVRTRRPAVAWPWKMGVPLMHSHRRHMTAVYLSKSHAVPACAWAEAYLLRLGLLADGAGAPRSAAAGLVLYGGLLGLLCCGRPSGRPFGGR